MKRSRYADDVVLIANNIQELNQMFNELNKNYQVGLHVRVGKHKESLHHIKYLVRRKKI